MCVVPPDWPGVCLSPHTHIPPIIGARARRGSGLMRHLTPGSHWSHSCVFLRIWIQSNLAITHPLMTTTDVTSPDMHLWCKSQFSPRPLIGQPFNTRASHWFALTSGCPRVSAQSSYTSAGISPPPPPARQSHREIRGYSTFNFITFFGIFSPSPTHFHYQERNSSHINPLHWF